MSSSFEGWIDPLLRPRLDIQLVGLDRPLQVHVDTSYSYILCIGEQDAREAGLVLNRRVLQQVDPWEHPAGEVMRSYGRIIWFGKQLRVPILVADHRYYQKALLPRLGLELLSDCTVNADFPAARVSVSRGRES